MIFREVRGEKQSESVKTSVAGKVMFHSKCYDSFLALYYFTRVMQIISVHI